MQEDCIESQGTQHGVALQKKKLKIREAQDTHSMQGSHVITRPILPLLKTGY
jgi:hypothetical protein